MPLRPRQHFFDFILSTTCSARHFRLYSELNFFLKNFVLGFRHGAANTGRMGVGQQHEAK